MIQNVKTEKEFNTFLGQKKTMVVDFWAKWCGPCKNIAPKYEKLEKKYGDKIIFLKIDVDDDKDEISEKYSVQSLPTFLFFDETGKVDDMIVGSNEEKLEKKLIKLHSNINTVVESSQSEESSEYTETDSDCLYTENVPDEEEIVLNTPNVVVNKVVSSLKEITSIQEFEDYVIHGKYHNNKYIILDFWAEWCRSCKMMMPKIQELSEIYHDKVTLLTINGDNFPGLVEIYKVASLPTFIILETGNPESKFEYLIGSKAGDKLVDKIKTLCTNELISYDEF